MQTQWRVGAGGASGLDYAGVRADLDERGLTPEERRDAYIGIKECERVTLQVWAEQRERAAEAQRVKQEGQQLLAGMRG